MITAPGRACVAVLALCLALALGACDSPGSDETAAPARPSSAMPAPVSPTGPPGAAADKPNVVLVTMDDMRWDEVRYAPTVRKVLEKRGLTFENSFAPLPLCCPARASLLTGQYPHNHGVLSHRPPYGFAALRDQTTLATRLQQAGYRTGFVGKYLNGYGKQRLRDSGRTSVTYVPPGWTDWMGALDGGTDHGSTYQYFDMTQNVNGRVTYHRGIYSSELVAKQAAGLVRTYAGDRPFFLWVNPVAPHHGGPREADDPRSVPSWGFRTPARPDWVKGRFDDQITHAPGVPANGTDPEPDNSDKPAYLRKLNPVTAQMRRSGTTLARQRAEAIAAWDHEFARIVTALKRSGEFDDTVLMFTSDNGYSLGEHRVMEGKIKPHEPSLRVPFLIAGPGIGRGVRYTPISTVDTTATILDLAGVELPADHDGVSRLPQMRGRDGAWTAPVLTEALLPKLKRRIDFPALNELGLRTGRYKFVRYATGEQELYDLRADPNELRNLASEPKHAGLVKRLRAIWDRSHDCAGRTCRTPLPADLQTSPQELREIDRNLEVQQRAYYDAAR